MANNTLLDMPGLAPSSNAQYLTPEMAQQLAGVAYAPEEQSGLQQQLAQALALRNGQQAPHQSARAALWDGLGDIARNIESHATEGRVRGQQADLLGSQKSAYGEYLKQLAQAQALRGQQPQQPQDPNAPQGGPL